MMRGLIERGHAYEADGNVYFDVRSFPDYLELSNQDLDDLRQPSGDGETGKRDPRDFAMWKAVKPGEPSWETPWGRGRPGWHLECSAMAHKYLGSAFDIHGGGLDLIFPHHENEIAQAKAFGDEFAKYWVHNAWVTMSGEKMSKSLGNSVLVSEMVKNVAPHRAALLPRHPALPLDDRVQRGSAARGRVRLRPHRGLHPARHREGRGSRPRRRRGAAGVRRGHGRRPGRPAGPRHRPHHRPPGQLAHWPPTTRKPLSPASPRSVPCSVSSASTRSTRTGPARPTAARTSTAPSTRSYASCSSSAKQPAARKDWATADAIRDQLNQSGLVIEDSPDGPRWTLGPR